MFFTEVVGDLCGGISSTLLLGFFCELNNEKGLFLSVLAICQGDLA